MNRRKRPPGGTWGQLVVMARWPAAGRCKRRLASGIGPHRAAVVQARLCRHALVVARQAADSMESRGVEVVLAVGGLGSRGASLWGQNLKADRAIPQGEGSLGLRLQRQVKRAMREGAAGVVIIGSDLPELAAVDLIGAFEALERFPLVLGPATDGGYWLIGLRSGCAKLFSGARAAIPWGGDRVFADTLAAAHQADLASTLLSLQGDLDRPADLLRWR